MMHVKQYHEPEDVILSPQQMTECRDAFAHAVNTERDRDICAKLAFRLGHSMINVGRIAGDDDMEAHGRLIVRRWRSIMNGAAPWPVPR